MTLYNKLTKYSTTCHALAPSIPSLTCPSIRRRWTIKRATGSCSWVKVVRIYIQQGELNPMCECTARPHTLADAQTYAEKWYGCCWGCYLRLAIFVWGNFYVCLLLWSFNAWRPSWNAATVLVWSIVGVMLAMVVVMVGVQVETNFRINWIQFFLSEECFFFLTETLINL